jgi:hypothetical protein
MMNRLRLTVFAAALALAGQARADTVQASSTTMLLGRQDFRDGSTITAVPAYELIDVNATDVHTRYADFQVALSTWGAVDLADRRFWQNGAPTGSSFSGDVNVGFLRADLLDRHLTLSLGRQMIADGTARMVQIDGGAGELRLPYNFGVSGYAGSPVAPRFSTRGGTEVVGNLGATFTSGGRAFWRYPGLLDVGFSAAMATDHGDWARQDLGVHVKFTPHRLIVLTGSGFYSLFEDRIGEGAVAAQVFPLHGLDVTVDYRHVEPDLFLARNSILAVFAADKRNDVGGAVHYGGFKLVSLDADYHYLIEDAGHGHWARLKGTAHPCVSTTAGVELAYLKNAASVDNGYKQVRLFGAKELYKVTGTLDLNGYFYDGAINGEKKSLLATATVAYPLWGGWRATVAGSAGTTPYMERQFDIMAKLVYDQVYAVREVR